MDAAARQKRPSLQGKRDLVQRQKRPSTEAIKVSGNISHGGWPVQGLRESKCGPCSGSKDDLPMTREQALEQVSFSISRFLSLLKETY